MAVVAAVATLILIAFLLWFTFGTHRNIVRGNELLQWLQDGLPVLGRRTTVRWLGSSAVQLDIAEAETPYTTAQVNVVLEPRDIGFLWAWARRRGRRDFLILRGTLPAPPRFEVEAAGSQGWTRSDRLDRLDPGAWIRTRWPDGDGDGDGDDSDDGARIDVAHSSRADVDDLDAVRACWGDLAAAGGGRVWRLSVRNLAPHVEVHLLPPASEAIAGAEAGRAGATGKAGAAGDLTAAFAALGRLARRDATAQ